MNFPWGIPKYSQKQPQIPGENQNFLNGDEKLQNMEIQTVKFEYLKTWVQKVSWNQK